MTDPRPRADPGAAHPSPVAGSGAAGAAAAHTVYGDAEQTGSPEVAPLRGETTELPGQAGPEAAPLRGETAELPGQAGSERAPPQRGDSQATRAGGL